MRILSLGGLWSRFLVGVVLAETVLLAMMFLSKEAGDVGKVFFSMVAAFAIYLLGRYWLKLTMMGDVYKVADKVLPETLADLGITVNTSVINVEPFQDLYLVEYSLDNLTVVWDVEKGVVGHRFRSIDDLKKDLQPRGARQVLTSEQAEGKKEEEGGEGGEG